MTRPRKEPSPQERLKNWLSILGPDALIPHTPPPLTASPMASTRDVLQPFSKKNKEQILQAISERVKKCRACGLYASRKQVVLSDGSPDADIFFIGEAPGAQEDHQGIPFVGPAGQLLTRIIEQGIKIPRNETFIANILKCRPPGNRRPLPEEIQSCSPFLLEQIRCVSPKILIALGATAARFFLKTQAPMRSLRGRVHQVLGLPLIVTWHPSYLLRRPEAKVETWRDIQLAMKVLEKRNGNKGARAE
ncbi:MAG TPA: uracil-DNA glycosylase [Planctomycetes bacterium]|nr:uracil-DNA glycosylase [Planctomycetota bacterium]